MTTIHFHTLIVDELVYSKVTFWSLNPLDSHIFSSLVQVSYLPLKLFKKCE
jgi:hypothetical protein